MHGWFITVIRENGGEVVEDVAMRTTAVASGARLFNCAVTAYDRFHSTAVHILSSSMAYNGAPTNGSLGFLSAGKPTSRRVSAGGMKGRKSSSSFTSTPEEEDGGHGMHSLAHELAVALMPEPSAGQRMLQEELGIEYDEGAEGIDEPPDTPSVRTGSLADEFNGTLEYEAPSVTLESDFVGNEDLAAHFGSGANAMVQEVVPEPEIRSPPARDPMDILSKELESTDKFISQLKQLDSEVASSSSQPSIEKLASDMIRHLNEAVRDREGQVRELQALEREFRKIASEVNGNDVLGQLDALEGPEGLSDRTAAVDATRPDGRLQTVQEEPKSRRQRSYSNDWETNPDDLMDEETEYDEAPESPFATKESFTAPPTSGPPTVPNILPHVAHIRSLTSTLASSLTAISEHAQVNGAANTDAGRKIRALKNKLGGWRSEQESAEKSRIKIERWEAGITDDDTPLPSTPPGRPSARRIDAKRFTDEHLQAFEAALADAGMKTKAIMARS